MYVSFQFSPQSRGPQEDEVLLEDMVDRTLLADRAGVASISLTEHHLGGFNTYSDPFMMGSYLAPQVRDLFLTIMVVQVPLEHPLRIAEKANLLDQLTKGRSLIALATGSPRQMELDSFGVAFADRSDMTDQKVEALVRAWGWDEAAGPVSLATDYDQGTIAARVTPAPYRQPHPLVGRATASDEAILDCARRGWPAIVIFGGVGDEGGAAKARGYREALEQAGHDEATLEECLAWLGPVLLCSIAPTEREAKRRYDEFVEAGGAGPIVTDPRTGTAEWVAEWRLRQEQRAQFAFHGSPDMVAERLAQSAAMIDANHVRVMLLDTPGRDEENLECYRLFLEEVVPQLGPERIPGPRRTTAGAAEVAPPA